jgi:hypothetical protein
MIYLLKSGQEGEDNVERLYSIIITFSAPLLQEIAWLGREMSASHVIRSLMSLLLGLPVIAERKVIAFHLFT